MAAPQGVSVAWAQNALAETPDWTRLDSRTDISITGWSTRRGRTYLTDRMDSGTAQIDFADTKGVLDPTNADGPFWPMDPNCPVAIALFNPVTETWHTVYTGLLQQMPQTLDVSAKISTGSLMLADLFSLLALAEVPPGLDFADDGTSAGNTIGDTRYVEQPVQDRLEQVLADANVPSGLTSIFSGNVVVQESVEAAGTAILAVLQDAADAEFPGVANLYVDKNGIITFHGRLARFNPTDPTYGIQTWDVGDTAAVKASGGDGMALISGITWDRDVAKVINAALVTPENILDSQIPGQLVADGGTSIDQFGNRVYRAENLLTAQGLESGTPNANVETKKFGQYYVDNFAAAANSISQLTFRWVPVGARNDDAHWNFLCNVELNDIVNVNTVHPGGGGFLEPYYVEGISIEARPSGQPGIADVTLTLDLSPQGYYDSNPFS